MVRPSGSPRPTPTQRWGIDSDRVKYSSSVRSRISVTPAATHLLMSVLLTVEIAAVGACRSDRTRALEERALAASRAIPLARSRRSLDPPRPCAQVLVGTQSLEVDDTAFFDVLPPAERKHLLAGLPPGQAPETPFFRPCLLSGGRTIPSTGDALALKPTEIASLPDLLRREVEIERRAESMDMGGPVVNVRFQRDTPSQSCWGCSRQPSTPISSLCRSSRGLAAKVFSSLTRKGWENAVVPRPNFELGPAGSWSRSNLAPVLCSRPRSPARRSSDRVGSESWLMTASAHRFHARVEASTCLQ